MKQTLLQRLTSADLICSDCGDKYGKYSAGCSTYHVAACDVCGKTAPVTEVRDFGYLQFGICAEKLKIKGQSKEVAEYIAFAESYDDDQPASYEEGELTCKFTVDEVTALAEVLNAYEGENPPGENTDFDSAFMKIMELYGDECVEYSLSPVTAAYYKKYGTYGLSLDEAHRYQTFKDNYDMLLELGFIEEGDNA
jgi:hypothetical protein